MFSKYSINYKINKIAKAKKAIKKSHFQSKKMKDIR